MKTNNVGVFHRSIERNVIGSVKATYKEIRELFDVKSVLNFSGMRLIFIQSGNLK